MSVQRQLASIARGLTGHAVFRKKLPSTFGSARIHVTTSSDIRLLVPGLGSSSADLFLVARNYIHPGHCVWDIGSNLGIFSTCAAYRSGPQGSVYSLEADPKYAELHGRTVRGLSDRYAPCNVLCAAIAHEAGVLSLAIPKRGHSQNHLTLVERDDMLDQAL